MRHIEGGESSPTEELIDLVEQIDNFEGIFQMDEEFENAAADDIEDDLLQHLVEEQQQQQQQYATTTLTHFNHYNSNNNNLYNTNNNNFNNNRLMNNNDCNYLLNNGEFETDTETEIDFAAAQAFDADEQAQINRILGYRNYPQFLIDDENAGFPALHEIDFDESQQPYNEWSEKSNSNNLPWHEQFAQWSFNTPKN